MQSASSPVTVNAGYGNDTINIGNADHPYSIAGALTINGEGGGTNKLNIDDQAPQPSFTTYTLSNATVTPSDSAAITYGDITSMAVNGSSNLGTSGGDEFVVTVMPTIPVTLNGGTGPNLLTGPNASNTWTITGPITGNVNSLVTFADVGFLKGGTGVDVFKFDPAGTVLSINGGRAMAGLGDWLDYTRFTTTVSVNLATGSATNVNGGAVGSVSNIMNVYGDNGGGTLTGNSTGNILVSGTGNDTIHGGSGSSILIADKGEDQLVVGSASGDILIGGYNSYDSDKIANITALMELLAVWRSTVSYASCFSEIDTGVGIPGGYELNFGMTVKSAGVFDTLTAATVTDNPLNHWFFGNFSGTNTDTIVNFGTGEYEDNTLT